VNHAHDVDAVSSAFPSGGSEMARLIRAHDWSRSLGSPATWPTSLKTTVSLMLHSPVPLVLLWGADGIMIYNDAYGVFAGNRHPGLLGSKVLEGWPEAAELNSRVMAVGMAGGTLEFKDHELALNRRGRPETAWMDLFYSPVVAENGMPGGVIAVVVETTDRVLARRETAAQRERLAQMFQDAPSFMAQLDGPEHVYAFTNNAYQRLIARRDVLGRRIRDALPEIADQGFFDLLDQVYRSGKGFRGHAVPVTLVGEPGATPQRRLLDFIYQPVRDGSGTVTGIFVEGIDVTESAEALAALKANAERLRFFDALGREAAKSHDADAVLATTTRMVGEYLGVSVCAYADMDADQDGFTIRGDWSAAGSPSIVGHYRLADFGRKAVGELRAGRPLVIGDNRKELAPDEAAAFQALGISATICMPLVKEGRLIALMAIHQKTPHAWTENELAVIREVTERSWAHIERVRSQAQSRESAERLHLAAEAAQIGTFDFNPITRELKWDDRCKALFGLPPDAAITYETFLAFVQPEDRERTDAAVRRAVTAPEPTSFELEYRIVRSDGTERWIHATGRTLSEGGRAVRFIGTVMDISEQKRVEFLLRASEEQFRTMAQAVPNHVWTANADGEIEWVNDQVYAYTGAPRGTFSGRGWSRIVHMDDLAGAERRWGRAVATGETFQTEYRLRRADGQWRWHLARAVAIKEDGGSVTRWIGTDTDIQDQKDVNATLELRVAERTGQLRQAEEALRQSQKMEAVGQLTGGIAHDFNNLLQAITGSLERVQHRVATGRYAEIDRFLKASMEAASRAAALTHRLLAFSRRQTLDPRPTDVNRLIGSMEELITRTMGPAVTVEVVGAVGLWPIRVDGSQLENSLLNLCINARDAMPDGGRLTIETANKWLDENASRERDMPPGQYISLCVTDTGVGIPSAVMPRIFDPFFTTKPAGSGTGLGLSMVYGFVRQSGGQVRVYSEVGKGTTMCLYFPRYMGEVVPEGDEAGAPVEHGWGEVILLVDDEPTVRMLVAEVLVENNYRVLEAGDGPSALRVLESGQRIDFMITDVGLPGGMNGRQLAEAARTIRTGLKVLFITGYAENATRGIWQLEPGMQVLAKPFPMTTLANKVREMLEQP
jgi:PAS domain S-box-containing protein